MAKGKELKVTLTLDDIEYIKRLTKAQHQGKQFKDNWKMTAMGISSAMGIVRNVMSSVSSAIGKLIADTNRQEKAERQLAARLKSTGHAAGLSAKEITSMASALQSVTTFGDEAILEGQNLLLTFTKIGKDVFPAATEAMLDMSVAMDQDMKSSAIQLGKALNDPILGVSALSRVGVQFTESQKATIKSLVNTGKVAEAQKIILQELNTQMGGSARAAALDFGGSVQQLKNRIGDAGEEIGKNMLPGLRSLVGALNQSFNPTGVLSRAMGALGRAVSYVADNVAKLIRYFDIANNTSQTDRLQQKSRQLMAEIRSYQARGLDNSSPLIAQRRQQLAEINEQMELLSQNTIQIGKDSEREWNKVGAEISNFSGQMKTTTDDAGRAADAAKDKWYKLGLEIATSITPATIAQDAFKSTEDASRKAVYDMMYGKNGWKNFGDAFRQIIKQMIADIVYMTIKVLALRAAMAAFGGGGGLFGGGLAKGLASIFQDGYSPVFANGYNPPRFAYGMPVAAGGIIPSNHFPAWIGDDEFVINAASSRANAGILAAMNQRPGSAVGGGNYRFEIPVILDGREIGRATDEYRDETARNSGAMNYGRKSFWR